MLRTGFDAAFDFVIIYVRASDCFYVLLVSEETLEMIHHLLIALRRFGLTGRMSLKVRKAVAESEGFDVPNPS
jgi:hypothetical protein